MSHRHVSFAVPERSPSKTPEPQLELPVTREHRPTVQSELSFDFIMDLLQIPRHLRDTVRDDMLYTNEVVAAELRGRCERGEGAICKAACRVYLHERGGTLWGDYGEFLDPQESPLGGVDRPLSVHLDKHILAQLLVLAFQSLRSHQETLRRLDKEILAKKDQRLNAAGTNPKSVSEQTCSQCKSICQTCSNAESSAEASLLSKIDTRPLIREPREASLINSLLMTEYPNHKRGEFTRTKLFVGNTVPTNTPPQEVSFKEFVNLKSFFTERFVARAGLKSSDTINCIHVTYGWNRGYGRIGWGNKEDLRIFKEEVCDGWLDYPEDESERAKCRFIYEIMLRVEPKVIEEAADEAET